MKQGLLIILSGPSGVGKGTIRKRIMLDPSLNLIYSVSMTTRKIRPGEEDGKDYFFVSQETFQKNINDNQFLEWAEFVGNRYGTPKAEIQKLRQAGKNVLLEIEINGAKQVISKATGPGLVTIFLMPPSFEALEARIRKRKTESEAIIQERLAKARREMNLHHDYQYLIVNDDVEKTSQQIIDIIKERMSSMQ
ncbi:MAG: guanylate kinase [Firmicutes bacterium]|nr:guanylate kinase [Bacillota bacterium]